MISAQNKAFTMQHIMMQKCLKNIILSLISPLKVLEFHFWKKCGNHDTVHWWGLWQCHCCQMLYGQRKIWETLACHDHPTPLTQDTWQGVRGLGSLSYAPRMAKHVDQRIPTWSGSAATTVPWYIWYVASKTDETSSASLLLKLGIKDITSILCFWRFIWYGHVRGGHVLYQIYHKLSTSQH